MKKNLLPFAFYFLFLTVTFAQNVGVNSTGASPDASAMLDVESSDKGLLLPRMTTAQRDAIVSPALSLMIFNTTTNCFEAYVGGAWNSVSCPTACVPPAAPTSVTGNTSSPVNTVGLIYSISPVIGATSYLWTVPTGSTITAGQGSTSITVTSGITSGNISVTASNTCGTSAATTLAVTYLFRSCNDILIALPSSIDGVYTIDPDGTGVLPSMSCQCDMTTDGGGWTLVANYLRQGGVTGVPIARTYLPLVASSTLGVHESANLSAWGHGNLNIMNALPFTDIRYYGETSRHSRIMHYRNANGVTYFKTGIGLFTMSMGYTLLAGHTSNLPAWAPLGVGVSGGSSVLVTNNNLWIGGVYMTTTGTPNCGNSNAKNVILGGYGGTVWEVDNYAFGGCPGYTVTSVLFRAWVR